MSPCGRGMGRSALELAGDPGQDVPSLLVGGSWRTGRLSWLPLSLCQLCSVLGEMPLGGVPCMKRCVPKLG